jgi:hypothetical protein
VRTAAAGFAPEQGASRADEQVTWFQCRVP